MEALAISNAICLLGVSRWNNCCQHGIMKIRYEGSLQQNSAEMVGVSRRWGYYPQHPTASEVLDFLHAFFMQVLGYSAINSYGSALSSLLQVWGIERIGEHILVPWLMKSVFNLRSPQPRYSKMWDVIKVLLYPKRLVGMKTLPFASQL